jgi:hypothetical protein
LTYPQSIKVHQRSHLDVEPTMFGCQLGISMIAKMPLYFCLLTSSSLCSICAYFGLFPLVSFQNDQPKAKTPLSHATFTPEMQSSSR